MKQHMQQISVAKMRMLRWMSGKTRIDRITNERIRGHGHLWVVAMGNTRSQKRLIEMVWSLDMSNTGQQWQW